jgi:Flp pilus assembly protein TadG
MISPDVRNERRNERGGILVELTMVVPLLVFLVLGMIEMGSAWQDQQTITQASRQGARVASHLGDGERADQEGVRAVLSVFDAEQRARINYIVIYEVTTADGVMPAACKTASVAGVCNRYAGTALSDTALNTNSNWPCSTGTAGQKAAALDRFYSPCTRSTSVTGSGPEHLGVYISVNRPWFTGFLPGTGINIKASTVMQLEPEIS